MRSRFLAAACAAAAVFCAAAQTGSTLAATVPRIGANDLEADVSFLASDALQGRATPSPGLDIAAEYIAAGFRRAGLEPAAGNLGFFQNAGYISVRPNPDGLELTLETGGEAIRLDKSKLWLEDAGPVDLSHAPLRLVKTGGAAGLNALAPDDLRGRVLVVDATGSARAGGELRRLAPRIAELHPALVVVMRTGRPPAEAREPLREASAPGPVATVAVFDDAFRRAIAAPRPGGAALTVSAHIAAPTVSPVRLRNVVGVLRGSDDALRDTYLLVTAHYDHLGVRGSGPGDHIFNGANDNASGTASVIEIANALARLPSRPRRSIAFVAFFGEELGLVGSRYYVRHPAFPLAKTVAEINLEQMGRTDDSTGSHVGMVNVTGFDFTTITAVLRAAGKETGVRVVKDEKASDIYYTASDNWSFAEAGVPSHTLSVAYEFPDYHQPGDEWGKLDYQNMAGVDRTIALAAFRIANDPEAPRWNTANPKTERFVRAKEKREGQTGATTK